MHLEDDRLRLILTCCHPALNQAAQIALTLRTLGGPTTSEIAKRFSCPSRRWRSGSCAPSGHRRADSPRQRQRSNGPTFSFGKTSVVFGMADAESVLRNYDVAPDGSRFVVVKQQRVPVK